MLTPQQLALHANQVTRRCLEECDGDVSAALSAAEYILATQPVDVALVFNPPNDLIDAFFTHDIQNRRAQGILSRSLKAAKNLSASAKRELGAALKLGAGASGEAIINFITKYRTKLTNLLTTTQLASVLEGAREVAKDIPTLAIFHGAVPPPPTLEPKEAVELVERLEKLNGEERAAVIYELPTAHQTYAQQAIAAKEAGGPIVPPTFTPRGGVSDEGSIHFPIIDEAVKHLSEKNILTHQKYDELDAAARAKSFTVARVDSDQTLEKIRDALAENVKQGADYETFRKEIMGTVYQGTFMSDAHMECFLPGTVVEGAVLAASKVWYSGPAVEIEMDSGNRLRVTINHPILTPSGWKHAGVIEEGGHLVCYVDSTEPLNSLVLPPQRITIDDQYAPAFIEDVFESVLMQSATRLDCKRPVTPLDFHGDGSFGQGNVHCVRPEAIPVRLMCFGKSAHLDPSVFYATNKSIGGDVQLASKLIVSLPGLVSTERVRKVKLIRWTGHVYDLQTATGFIVSQGIISGNCVFRTNIQSAFSDGQMTVLQNPLVRSGFPYVARHSIHDDRVRPHHKDLENLGIQGTNIYRVDDPVWQTFRSPWDYLCRCNDTFLTVRQAAEAGIHEAQKWLDTGEEPSEKAFVAMPDFAPPPNFQRLVSSAPLSIQLSLQSLGAFGFNPSEPRNDERLNLVAEILVWLFGDDAEEVAQSLGDQDGISAELAIGNPNVKRRYGKKPGPGWTSGGTSRNGQQIWIWGAGGGHGAAAQPVAAQPATPQQPTPVHTPSPLPNIATPWAPPPQAPPTPVQPQLRASGQKARAASIQAYNDAMTELNAGRALLPAHKLSLSKKLTNMPTGILRSLYTALGGRSTLPSAKAHVASVKMILGLPGVLTPQAAPQTPTTTSQPATLKDISDVLLDVWANKVIDPAKIKAAMTAVTSLSDFQLNVLMRGAGIKLNSSHIRSEKITDLQAFMQRTTGQLNGFDYKDGIRVQPTATKPAPATLGHSTIPFKDETVWETGKPQHGVVLNGISFESAPPKFWKKVKDVDVKEPKPITPIKRASIIIQEPDGRMWVVEPTNHFGRNHTLPGGGVEKGLSVQQNALKEVWEETGLQVEIIGFVGDFEDANNGNNGRLYLAKRIGGAPWDAKIETGPGSANIINHKTGLPAAESENVKLVTPEKAAQLLHKKDDLAQLAAVHPIDYKLGAGSERLKRLLEALKPKAKQYEAAHGYSGDSTLHAVQELRGFNAMPADVVSKKDMDAILAKGDHIEMLRGINPSGSTSGKDLAEAFRTGDHYPGLGIFGNGTYADSSKGHNNVASSGRYGSASGAGMIRMALPKTAKIIKQSELEKILGTQNSGKAPSSYSGGADAYKGIHAALAGYDAIHVDNGDYSKYGQGFYVVLNRGVVVVQKEDAKGHVIK